MIATSAALLSSLDEFAPDTAVLMNPPQNNPFISAASASFDQGTEVSQMRFTDDTRQEHGLPSNGSAGYPLKCPKGR